MTRQPRQPRARQASTPTPRFGPEPADPLRTVDVAADDPESVARSIALRRLTAAPQTRAQLEEALARRGVPDDVTERVLDRFEEVRLIDDVAYAESWVESRVRSRGLSRRALRAELARRGVSNADADTALAVLDPQAEEAAARALVVRKAPGTRSLPYDARVRRLAGMLARKGHSSATALRVVREVLAELDVTPASSPEGGCREVPVVVDDDLDVEFVPSLDEGS